jgi:hypothetical protein
MEPYKLHFLKYLRGLEIMRFIRFLLLIIPLAYQFGFADALLMPAEYDVKFGAAPQRATLVKKVVLLSTGDEPAVIKRIKTFCDCITIPIDSIPINPGDSVILDVRLETQNFTGYKTWGMHVFYNNAQVARFNVSAGISGQPENRKDMYVSPYAVVASQFGDQIVTEFAFKLINKTDEYIPLKLIYYDDEFFNLNFPAFIPPGESANGKVTLNQAGIENEFEKTIIFEYIDRQSEKHLYSVPIRRKIYK